MYLVLVNFVSSSCRVRGGSGNPLEIQVNQTHFQSKTPLDGTESIKDNVKKLKNVRSRDMKRPPKPCPSSFVTELSGQILACLNVVTSPLCLMSPTSATLSQLFTTIVLS